MEGKILIIEDSPEILENIVEILQLEHYEVFSARDAQTGMDLARTIRPDVILCDILIPGKSAFDVLNYVRSTTGIDSVPFIFVTSQSERDNIQKARDLGASGYIVKPFDGQTLLDGVAGFVRIAGSRLPNPATGSDPDPLRTAEG